MLLRGLSLDAGRFGPVALYTRATALCGLAMMIPAALGPLLYARWSGTAGPARRAQVELAARLNVAYGVAVAIGLAVGGRVLLRGIYGPAFVAAQPAIYALAPAYALKALFDVYINLFASDGRAGLTAAILGGATGVAITATVLLVPAMGFAGAAVAVLLADVFCVAAAATVGWRLHGVSLARCLVVGPSDLRLVVAQLSPRPRPDLRGEQGGPGHDRGVLSR
jgi:O-antigen/teichoic acid export membrane protein